MGFSTSQWISVVAIVVSIVFYFAANSGLKQNAFLYVFGIALTVLIVGTFILIIRSFVHERKGIRILTSLLKLAKEKRCLDGSLIL